ncbi:MAG: FAD-dependent oxidoreductase [Acidobacteriales bacterium]|nr:FAD-dependent oxidoreductase [Terriglobales bacterium]
MASFQSFSARLVNAKQLSLPTRHLQFEIEGKERFGFIPGQWLSFKASESSGEEITRAYSIASPPAHDARFELCLNRVQDGFMSNFLCDMKAGGVVQCQGPFGNFTLRPPLRDTIFIATGTGIAPFRSMLHWLFADELRHLNRNLWLVFGSRTEADIYYHSEFLALAGKHANFHYLPTLSRADESWEGLRGYVQEHVKEIADKRTDMHAYICGLDKMVKVNRDLLKELGWDRKSILYEKYD